MKFYKYDLAQLELTYVYSEKIIHKNGKIAILRE